MMFSPCGTTLARENSLLLFAVANIFQVVYCVDNIVCNVNDIARQDCGWSGITSKKCQARNCCWKAPSTLAPWCFFDSATATKLHTVKACEHHSPVSLKCNENETINIHDVFYGRNNGDPLCHLNGITTCFNPNATEIVRNICKSNSTCFISPRGKNWDFDKNCDALNAQLIVHFVCTSQDHKVNVSSSSAFEGGITAKPAHTSRIYAKSSLAIGSTFYVKAVIPSTETPTISLVLSSEKATPSITIGTSTKQVCRCSDVAALSVEMERKDRVIIGLSALLILLALAAVLWVVLLCRKNNCYKVKEKHDDVLHMESAHSRKDSKSKPGCANSTYDGVGLPNENNTYDGVEFEDENPYYASN